MALRSLLMGRRRFAASVVVALLGGTLAGAVLSQGNETGGDKSLTSGCKNADGVVVIMKGAPASSSVEAAFRSFPGVRAVFWTASITNEVDALFGTRQPKAEPQKLDGAYHAVVAADEARTLANAIQARTGTVLVARFSPIDGQQQTRSNSFEHERLIYLNSSPNWCKA